MQALFERSEEAPEVRGLGLYPGTVRRFPADARVPHMGWNELDVQPASRLFRGLPAAPLRLFRAQLLRAARRARLCHLHLRTCPTPPRSNAATSSACNSTPKNPAEAGLHIVRNFVELPC